MPSDIDELLKRADQPVDPDTKDRPDFDPAKADAEVKTKAKAEGRKLPRVDPYITGFYIFLCFFSVVELYSASSREVTGSNVFAPLVRHLVILLGSAALCFWISRRSMQTIVRFTPWFVVISVLMMIYVLINGQIINGARRSFSVAGIPVQPSEFLKLSAVLIIAYIMARFQLKKGGVRTKGVVLCAAIVTLFSGLLFSQGLTNTLLLMGISMSMMVIGGVQWRKLGLVIVFYGLVGMGGIMYKMHTKDSQNVEQIVSTGVDADGNRKTANRAGIWEARFLRFFSDSIPKYDQPITAQNRQEMYSYMAQANGGVFGVKPGNSRETARLPLAFSDYIFSIVVEDWGFIGGIFLLIIYISILLRAGGIASRCDRAFPAMIEMGLAVMITIQALFHMAITTGLFPVSGQPLPMISKGGTSMLITSVAFGLMLCVSRYARSRNKRAQGPALKAELPENINSSNPGKL